jgi:clumping factor A
MIVGSLLLILVAVTLLVLGLAAGSSTLLISSIVTSLLAAVALVVGARHAAGIRRAQSSAPEPLAVDLDDDPGPVAPVEEPFTSRVGTVTSDVEAPDPDPVHAGAADTEVFHQDAVFSQDADDPAGPDLSEDPDPSADPEPTEDERPGAPGLAGLRFSPDAGGRSTGALDRTDDRPAATSSAATSSAATPSAATDDPIGVPPFDADRLPPDRAQTPGSEREAGRDAEPHADFDRAQSVIGAARAQDPDDSAALRREPGDPAVEDDDYSAEDPADEPPVQRIQPDEAVRVARMPNEVVVVDGRPRYHVADCPHLADRSIEPLPVAEAVELGFTPCGLCRPVDRLVARPARR